MQTVKWLQVLLFNTNYSIQHNSFVFIQSNGSKYCYVLTIIQFRHTIKGFQVLAFNTNSSNQYYLFVSGGARGVIAVGNGHDDTSSNPGQDWLHFT